MIPHVTDAIKEFIFNDLTDEDFVLCEIGGTVGDIESLPFLEAIRQIGNEIGKQQACFVHVTLLPYIAAAGELKTKPTRILSKNCSLSVFSLISYYAELNIPCLQNNGQRLGCSAMSGQMRSFLPKM